MFALSLAAAVVTVVVAAAVQGVTGSGFGIVAAPVLIVLWPQVIPGTLLWLATAVCTLTAARERSHIDWPFVQRCCAAAVPGTAVGFAIAEALPAHILMMCVGTVVVASGIAGLAGARVPITGGTTLVAGVGAGMLNYLAALPGPPVALTYRGPSAATVRSTLSAIFAVLSVATLALLAAGNRSSPHDAAVAGLLLGPVLVGFAVAIPLSRRVSATTVSRAALMLSVLGGAALVIRTW